MLALFWVINFAVSWLNAWGCGKTWTESKHVGGVPHFLSWCGSVMSAAGFTWCYLVLIGGLGTMVPLEADDGTTTYLLSGEAVQAFADMGYLVVVFPILGSGLAITVHSWGVFWRRRNFSAGAVAGWNSCAQVYNTVSALQNVPGAAARLSDFFLKPSKNDKRSTVVLLVLAAALAGCLTTWLIVRSTARSTAFNRRLSYEAV